jgi:hypothetical protein
MKDKVRIVTIVAALLFLILPAAALARLDDKSEPDPVVKGADLYCTGFISEVEPRTDLQVVGGEKENLKNYFAQGDIVFLNKGREKGVQSGAVYYIIRPLGQFKHPFTKKKLGHFVRELGMLRVLEVQDKTSTAEILVSCDTVELGDLLKPYEEQKSPETQPDHPLPRYGEGSGGKRGRIVMSPVAREYFAANHIVYIDLGSRQGVKPGDNLTIFRKINHRERVATMPNYDIVEERNSNYGSHHYRGGDYASSSTRVPRGEVIEKRPEIPRKVLGEMVVLKVEKSTAVALITRTVAEVNIGDFVERSN